MSALSLDVLKSLQACQKLHSPEMIGKCNFYLRKVVPWFCHGDEKKKEKKKDNIWGKVSETKLFLSGVITNGGKT